jgi:hypothetical protein
MITLKVRTSTAELGDDGLWVSDDPGLQLLLRSGFPPELYPSSPANGFFPRLGQAKAAAQSLGGKLTIPPVHDDADEDEDVKVY